MLEDVFRNGYIVFVVIASLVISVLLLLSFIVAISCHAFRGGKTMPGKRTITCAIFSFMFCFCMAGLGTILFSNSIDHVREALDALPMQLNKSLEGMF
ncbi:hypothetical protein OESDEN_09157 [Oesophagostomum dentatum]|uniref:Uncharacterized protein n=1 Tax=Oesophagostomum dentatum TaxID=61180 RepID=A0A0B1T6F6_OESDE|nr:hypothetical protein OESDEN_09157 [Oesophagostomum dentatum]